MVSDVELIHEVAVAMRSLLEDAKKRAKAEQEKKAEDQKSCAQNVESKDWC